MAEPLRTVDMKALPDSAGPSPLGVGEDDHVPPLPRVAGRRKFSLFGLFPQASDYSLSKQDSDNSDQLSADNRSLTADTRNSSQNDHSKREEKVLIRSSSWSNFMATSMSYDIGSPPSVFNDNFASEVAIPSAYNTARTTAVPSSGSHHKPNLAERRQLTQAVETHHLFPKESLAQRDMLSVTEKTDTAMVHRTQSSSAIAALQNDFKEFKGSLKPSMPPPPQKPRKVRIRKQEINMFAPTSM